MCADPEESQWNRIDLVADAASRFAVCALATCLVVTPPSFAIEQPSAEAQATLRRGFKASSEGSAALADTLLTQSIVEWKATKQAPDEIAAIYKQRGTVRQQQNRLAEAAADLTEALKLDEAPAATPDPAEVQRTYVLRARVNAALKLWAAAEADLTAAIDRLDSLDAIESTNPYLFSERGSARSRLGDFSPWNVPCYRFSYPFFEVLKLPESRWAEKYLALQQHVLLLQKE